MIADTRPANDDMIEAYLDGRKAEELDFPDRLSNRGASYRHGWLNGRDDWVRNPRSSVAILRGQANVAMDKDAGR